MARKNEEPEVTVKSVTVGTCSLCFGRVVSRAGRVSCERCRGVPVAEHGPTVLMRPSTKHDRLEDSP